MEVISDSDELYRRLAPNHINPADGSVNSNAYQRNGLPDPRISVDLARLTTPDQSLAPVQGRGFGLGVLTARVPRSMDLQVRHAPVDGNVAHALIEGENTRTRCRLLAEATVLLMAPQHGTGPEPGDS